MLQDSLRPEDGGSMVLQNGWYPTTSLHGITTQKIVIWVCYVVYITGNWICYITVSGQFVNITQKGSVKNISGFLLPCYVYQFGFARPGYHSLREPKPQFFFSDCVMDKFW